MTVLMAKRCQNKAERGLNMNSNEKMERLKSNQLKDDDTFRFGCNQCGECCRNRHDILLSPYDLYRIARYLKTPVLEVVLKYCDHYIGQDSHIPVVRAKPKIHNAVCPFLKNGKCSIHEAKPAVCALFPLGRAADATGEIRYFYSGGCDCADKTEVSLKEWIDKFNLRESEEPAKLWGQLVSKISMARMRIKNDIDREQKLNIVFFDMLYLDYSIDEDFLPQYKENAKFVCYMFEKIYGCTIEKALKGIPIKGFDGLN